MGWRGTIALAAVFVLAALFAYNDLVSSTGKLDVHSILAPPVPTPPARGFHSLLIFDPGEIVGITIRRGNEETHLRRDGATWSGVTPPDAADDFLENVRDLSEILVLDVPAAELADHGLDPPRIQVTLERRAAPPLSLRVGNHNPPATGVYVQTSEKKQVILTGALLLWEVEKLVKAAQAQPQVGG
jgi:hypothetical protein